MKVCRYMMFFNNFRSNDYEFNECTSHGACSISPDITSLQEALLILMRQLAFYELKLYDLEAAHFENKEVILNSISSLVNTKDYNDEQMLEIISQIYSGLISSRRNYIKVCKERGVDCEDLKFALKLTPQMTLPSIIQEGEKAFLEKYKTISPAQKNMAEILVLIIKSLCSNLISLRNFDKTDDNAYYSLLKGLNLLNYKRVSLDKIKRKIDELAKIDFQMIALLDKSQRTVYGEISETKVSCSTEPGKAILVSGTNFDNLYDILEVVQGTDIDIYSHADLMIAHAFSAFKSFENFKGHYGNCMENCVLDFATFPGAILLTKNSARNLEYLYRGRLFSAEAPPPKGVVQIKDNDFTALIDSAMSAKGFSKGRKMNDVTVGCNFDEIIEKIDDIAERFNSGEIEHLFVIGISNYSSAQSEYFGKLLKLIPKKSFVISFSYHNDCDNMLYVNLVNNLPLVYNVLDKLFKKVPITSDNLTFFLTKCDVNSVSNMISLKNKGAKSIYLSKCPPMIISPSLLSALDTLYGIRDTTSAGADLEMILHKKETD